MKNNVIEGFGPPMERKEENEKVEVGDEVVCFISPAHISSLFIAEGEFATPEEVRGGRGFAHLQEGRSESSRGIGQRRHNR